MLVPDLRIQSVTELTPEVLLQQGLSALLVDLDDTLVASHSQTMSEEFRGWLESLKAADVALLLLSNGHPKRVSYWSQELGIEGLALVGKPFGFAYRRGLKRLGKPAAQTAMVGDQLFTDILGAKRMGIKSILVTPLSPGGLPHTRLARKLESMILKGGNDGCSIHRR
jgi:uncharacterized protein